MTWKITEAIELFFGVLIIARGTFWMIVIGPRICKAAVAIYWPAPAPAAAASAIFRAAINLFVDEI